MNDGTIYSFVVLNSEKFLNELTTMGLGMWGKTTYYY
jgi:hypothetical protein